MIRDYHLNQLRTVVSCVLEDLSFDAPSLSGTEFVVTEAYVVKQTSKLQRNVSIEHYIL
jgi:ATP-dependent protease HslVU (ClpYQ) ATPase subunit